MDHLKAVDTTDDLHNNSNPPSIAGVLLCFWSPPTLEGIDGALAAKCSTTFPLTVSVCCYWHLKSTESVPKQQIVSQQINNELKLTVKRYKAEGSSRFSWSIFWRFNTTKMF